MKTKNTHQQRDSKTVTNSQIQAIYPANSLQQGFIAHAISHPLDDAYRVQSLCDYHVAIDVDCYQRAWELAIQTYPILRTCFNWDEAPIQIITRAGKLRFHVHDITNESDKNAIITALIQADRLQRFDLAEPTLLRIALIKQTDTHYTLLKSEHHLIGDAWSAPILLNRVHEYYQDLMLGKEPIIVEDTAYLQAQAYIAKNQALAQHHWQTVLEMVHTANDINSLFTKRADLTQLATVQQSRELTIDLNASLVERLQKLVADEGITLHGLMQFAWHKLLHTYTQENQTIVGTTISGRELPISGIEKSVGQYINTLPLLVDWDNTLTVREQLHQIHAAIKGLSEYSYVYLATLQKEGRRLFHSLLLVENAAMMTSSHDNQSILSATNRRGVQKLNYPLALTFQLHPNAMSVNFKYDEIYLTETRAHELLQHFLLILNQLPCKLSQPHSTLALLDSELQERILVQWNSTDHPYPSDQTLHALFQAQAARTPHAIAIQYNNTQMTYAECDLASNQLANWLLDQGLAPGSRVALCLDRSFEMVIAILGILKAGAAYVPIDPRYPEERIRFILNDTKTAYVITQSIYLSMLSIQASATIQLIALDNRPYQHASTTAPIIASLPTDIAYIIYTSGTTGNPKGAALTHRGIVNRIDWMQRAYPLSEQDVVLQKTPYTFDVSVWEILWAHWVGAKIVLATPDGHKDPDYLIKLITESKITTLHFVPSMLSAFTETLSLSKQVLPNHLRYLFCSGEALLASQVAAFYQVSGEQVAVHNLYGPTEASIDVTAYACPRGVDAIYIGKPIQNTRVYNLDKHLKPVPVGVVGELYLGGVGLAQEYINQPNLTAAAFIANPFANETDHAQGYTRLYKTGDLVRWLSDGNIEYIGRRDFQVKIRGVRIELSEIEQTLARHPAITQAIVMVHEKNAADTIHRSLNAFYVGQVDSLEVRNYLSAILPEAMIPTTLTRVAAFPTNHNGKLDKEALLQTVGSNEQPQSNSSPITPLEKRLCEIWQTVLGIPQVGVTDNFFQLGGDSIQSIRLIAMMQAIGFYVSVSDIFQHKTIAQLIANTDHAAQTDNNTYQAFSLLDTATRAQLMAGEQSAIEDSYPAGYLQMGMLVASMKQDANGAYHDIFSYTIQRPLEKTKLLTLFKALCLKYPLLRTGFKEHATLGFLAVQYTDINLDEHYQGGITQSVTDLIEQEKNHHFSYEKPGLFRLFTINATPTEFVLVISFHHAITDGWSMASLMTEFTAAYVEGKAIINEPIPLYQRVIQQERAALTSIKQQTFWQSYLANGPIAITALRDTKPESSDNPLIEQGYLLDETDVSRVLTTANQYGVAPDMIFLAAYFKALSKLTNEQDMVIGLVINNRLEEAGGDKVFGLHLNTLPLRISVVDDPIQFISQLVKQRAELDAHKAYPYGKIRSHILKNRDAYTCAFNYIHFHVIKKERDTRALGTTQVFEKTSIPLTLHVTRFHEGFQVSIKASAAFIDLATTEVLIKQIQHELAVLIQKPITEHAAITLQASTLQQLTSQTPQSIIKPSTELEQTLCEIWQNLLDIPQVGITDNFFYLGGDSILSIRLVAMMRRVGFHVTVSDIFQHQSIAKLIECVDYTSSATVTDYKPYSLIDDAARIRILAKYQPGVIEDVYPSGYLQMGMLFESGKTQATSTYHDVFASTVNHALNEATLLSVFANLCEKHPLLRTSFHADEQYGYISVQHKKIDLANHYGGIIEQAVIDFIQHEKNQPFTIKNAGLFRLFVLNPTATQFVLIVSFHHVISDGWSMSSLLAEFVEAYRENQVIRQETIPPYQRVIAQERAILSSSTHAAFWQHYLANMPTPVINLVQHPMKRSPSPILEKAHFIDTEQHQKIIISAKQLAVSVDTLFLAAYLQALMKISEQYDIIIGLVMNNRLEETNGDKVIGLHLNTLPLRMVNSDNTIRFIEQLSQMRTMLDTQKAYPYGKIRQLLQAREIYTCAFNYIHFHHVDHKRQARSLTDTVVFENTSVPLTFHVARTEQGFRMAIKASNQFIDEVTAQELLKLVDTNMQAIINQTPIMKTAPHPINSSLPIDASHYQPYSLIDERAKQTILAGKNQNEIADIYPASSFQRHMLNESLQNGTLGTYHDVFAYTINQPLDESLVVSLFDQLCKKHPLLRTAFIKNNSDYLSVEYATNNAAAHYHGIVNAKTYEFIMHEKSQPHDYANPGLFRLFALNPEKDQFVLIISFHHAICDGWSMASLIAEFTAAYVNAKPIASEVIPPYQRVIQQELKALSSPVEQQFWRTYLSNAPQTIPTLMRHPDQTTLSALLEYNQQVSEEAGQEAIATAKRLGVSVDIVFLAALTQSIYQLTQEQRMTIGVVMNHRLEEAGGERVFGLHLNIVPLIINITSTSDDFILNLAKDRLKLMPHKIYPYTTLCQEWNKHFYQCAFNYTHFHVHERATKTSSTQAIYAYEKMAIPFILQVSRQHNVFTLFIRAANHFIDKQTAKELLILLERQLMPELAIA